MTSARLHTCRFIISRMALAIIVIILFWSLAGISLAENQDIVDSPTLNYMGTRTLQTDFNLLVIPLITIFLFGILWLWFLAFSGTRRVPPTHETTGLIHALVIIASLILAVLLVHGLIFWCMAPIGASPTLSRVLALALFLTPLIFIVGIFVLPYLQRNCQDTDSLCDFTENNVVNTAQEIIGQLERGMGKKYAVRVVKLSKPNVSPFAFGYPWSTARIALPANFEEMCSRACSGDCNRRQSLMRLILSHELSHVVGRDQLSLPLLWSYCLSLSFATAILWLLMPFLPASPLRAIVLPLAILLLAASLTGILIRRRILAARESLADAVATLSVEPSVLAELITPSSDGKPSPLESFLFLASLGQSRSAIILGGAFSGIMDWMFSHKWWKSRRALQAFRSIVNARGNKIRERIHLLPRSPVQIAWAVSTASVLAAFVWWVCARLKIGLVLLNDIPNTASANWLVHSFETNWHIHDSMISAIFTILTPMLSGIVAVTTLLLPYRDSFFEGIRLRRAEFAKVFGVILLMVFCSTICCSIFEPQFVTPLLKTIHLLPSTLPYGVFLFTTCVMFLVFVMVKWAPLLVNLQRLSRRLFPMLFMEFIPIAFVVAFFNGITIPARLLLFINAAMLTGIISVLIIKHKLDTDTYISSEWLEYERIILLRRFRIKAPGDLNRFDLSDALAGLCRGAITFTIPIMVIALIAYPYLLLLDTWFVENLSAITVKVSELGQITAEDMSGMASNILREHLFPYIILDVHRKFDANASTIIMGFSFAILVIPLFSALIFNIYREAENPLIMLPRYPILLALMRVLNPKRVDALIDSYAQIVRKNVSVDCAYLNGPECVPRMRATCDAVMALKERIPNDLYESMASWIGKCASPHGGYGFAPKMIPDALHTFHAVYALIRLGQLPAPDHRRHRKWVVDRLSELLSRRFDASPSANLQQTALLAGAMQNISGSEPEPTSVSDVEMAVTDWWKRCAQTVEDAANVICILSTCQMVAKSTLAAEIRSNIHVYEAYALASDPKANLDTIRLLVEMEMALFPDTCLMRPFFKQLKDIIVKTFPETDVDKRHAI